MKSITILSLSLFAIAITASLSLLLSPSFSASPPISLFHPLRHRLPLSPSAPLSMTLSLISPLFYLISLSLHLLLYLHCAGIFNLSFNLYFIFCFTFLCCFHLLFTFLLALFTLSSPTNFLPQMTASFLFHLLYCFFFFLFVARFFSYEHSWLQPGICFPLPLFHLCPFWPFLICFFLSSTHSAHPGWRDHRSYHRGGPGPAGAHRGHLLPDEVPSGTPSLQPQCQVSARPVAGGSLPVGFLPGTGAEAGAHPWHGHLRGQAGIAAVPRFDLVRCAGFKIEVSQL